MYLVVCFLQNPALFHQQSSPPQQSPPAQQPTPRGRAGGVSQYHEDDRRISQPSATAAGGTTAAVESIDDRITDSPRQAPASHHTALSSLCALRDVLTDRPSQPAGTNVPVTAVQPGSTIQEVASLSVSPRRSGGVPGSGQPKPTDWGSRVMPNDSVLRGYDQKFSEALSNERLRKEREGQGTSVVTQPLVNAAVETTSQSIERVAALSVQPSVSTAELRRSSGEVALKDYGAISPGISVSERVSDASKSGRVDQGAVVKSAAVSPPSVSSPVVRSVVSAAAVVALPASSATASVLQGGNSGNPSALSRSSEPRGSKSVGQARPQRSELHDKRSAADVIESRRLSDTGGSGKLSTSIVAGVKQSSSTAVAVASGAAVKPTMVDHS